MQETWVQSLGQEDPLEKEIATYSSIFAWEIPWTEEPGSPRGSRVRHNIETKMITTTHNGILVNHKKEWDMSFVAIGLVQM